MSSLETVPGPSIGGAGVTGEAPIRKKILYFVTEVWPKIRASYSDAVLDVLGNNPPRELTIYAQRDMSVRVHGFVPDVRPYFQAATVAVCPIRDGGGTRVKILDNLAMGKPIVSTTIGVEGLDLTPERDLLIADSPSDFEAQISRVFSDDALRTRLSDHARMVAENRYSWATIVARLLDAYQRAAAAREHLAH